MGKVSFIPFVAVCLSVLLVSKANSEISTALTRSGYVYEEHSSGEIYLFDLIEVVWNLSHIFCNYLTC